MGAGASVGVVEQTMPSDRLREGITGWMSVSSISNHRGLSERAREEERELQRRDWV